VATDFHDRLATHGSSTTWVTNVRTVVHEEDAEGQPDLYGNQVSDAVARFKLDDAGSLYEVHAPQIELPRLGSPVS
jgi:hypothetical protein